MASGSLTMGGTTTIYGGGYQWTGNTAGLLMDCAISVHDNGTR